MKCNIAQELMQETYINVQQPEWITAARLDDREVPSQLPATSHETLPYCLRAR